MRVSRKMASPRKGEVGLLYAIECEGLVGAEEAVRQLKALGFYPRAIGSH